MDAATADLAGNYEVAWASTRKVKKRLVTVLHPLRLSATYDAATNIVTLKTSGRVQQFVKGGEVIINGSGTTGVRSDAGVLLNPNYTHFRILPNARGITLE